VLERSRPTEARSRAVSRIIVTKWQQTPGRGHRDWNRSPVPVIGSAPQWQAPGSHQPKQVPLMLEPSARHDAG